MNYTSPQIIQLPKFLDSRGNLSFVEQENHIPFIIRRTYWLYDVPGGECRGGHAYRENQEFIVALSGVSMWCLMTERKKRRLRSTGHTTAYMFPKACGGKWKTFPPTRWL